MSIAAPPRRYVVYRTADMRRPIMGDGLPSLWKQAACSSCGEPVWHQPENLKPDMALVCWPCVDGAEL